MSLEDYAQTYLAGNNVASGGTRAAGARGKAYMFASPDGAIRHSLLLLQDGPKVYGLYSQGETPLFERQFPVLDEMARSLTLERPANYREERDDALASRSASRPPGGRRGASPAAARC